MFLLISSPPSSLVHTPLPPVLKLSGLHCLRLVPPVVTLTAGSCHFPAYVIHLPETLYQIKLRRWKTQIIL
ncbi:hypothetical protein AMECASPLE_016675 [Ameca splendens]|uniref:Uncharacterized protein n=1 Tax=Ameca splendens TaxID=208324 RepID=A0ABV1A9G9_9TELE